MDQTLAGQPVAVTRRGRESAIVISKASYQAYKKAIMILSIIKFQQQKIKSIKEIIFN